MNAYVTSIDPFEKERVLHVARKHVVYVLMRHIGQGFIVGAICLGIFLIGWGINMFIGLIAAITFFLIACLYVVMIYLGTYLMITTHRIISSHRYGFFRFHTEEIRVGDLKETTTSTNHFLEAIFHYGDIHIYGMDHEEMIRFRGIPHAKKVHHYIGKVIEMYHQHDLSLILENFDRNYDKRKQERLEKPTTKRTYQHVKKQVNTILYGVS